MGACPLEVFDADYHSRFKVSLCLPMFLSYNLNTLLMYFRTVLPLGRWLNLIDLVWSRKEYAFMYSKLLKPSKTDNSFQYMPSKADNPYELIKIHQYEMTLPCTTILAFRSAATAVAVAMHVQRTLHEASSPYASADSYVPLVKEVLPPQHPPPSNAMQTNENKKKSGWKTVANAFDKISHGQDTPDK